ncbi:SDR family oxidoreductase [Sutcliffiella cohnii]|uniref:SDR family oxidoreductase n=1 Tax=Sutcliffiella cohnii TaxID=33932 RepID=UPI002E22C393|nr:SDR family oxidoreductase [Sutcliffiella cohnii]
MDLGLRDKAVLVLASSGGLGKAGAMEFAKEGAKVMLFSSSEEKLSNTADEIISKTGNKNVRYTVGNLTVASDIKRVVNNTIEEFGRVDVLVNNSGGPKPGNFDAFTDDDWQDAFDLTLMSFVRSIREVLPYMRKQGGGRIVNSTSSSVKQVIDNLLLSNTFRMGVVGLTKTLSQELGKDNILINVIGPGRISTDRTKQLDTIKAEKTGKTSEEIESASRSLIPLGRYGTPEEYAKLMVFLCSDANTYITGQTILADGGLVKTF